MSKPLFIDNSTLRAVSACSTEAVMRYVHGYNTIDEIAVLKSGIDAHEALRLHFTGAEPKVSLAHFKKLYADWSEENVPKDGYVARLRYENLRKVMRGWMETHPPKAMPFRARKNMVEIPFQYPLDDNGDIMYTGAVDLVVKDADVDFAPVDHKTTGRISADWVSTFRNDSQFSGYMWACSQYTGEKILRGYVNAIEFSTLPSTPDRQCPKHKLPYSECGEEHINSRVILITRTPGQIESWRKKALKQAKRFQTWTERYGDPRDITKLGMEGSFYGHCRFCQFSEFCANGQPTKYLKTMFIVRKWNPLDRHSDTMGKEKADEQPKPKRKRPVSDE